MLRRLCVRRVVAPHMLVAALAAGVAMLVPVAAWALTATLTIPSLCAAPIPILAFSTQTSIATDLHLGAGGGVGKATLKPLVLTKAVDDCSPLLFRNVFLGRHEPTATLQVTGSSGATAFTIQLTNMLVVDVKVDFLKDSSRAIGVDLLTEQITLDAETFTFSGGGVTVRCNPDTNTCQ